MPTSNAMSRATKDESTGPEIPPGTTSTLAGSGKRGLPGKGYTVNDHPTKLWVNRWLAHTAANHIGQAESAAEPGFQSVPCHCESGAVAAPLSSAASNQAACLVLETSGLHTVRALRAAKVISDPSTVVVPNPDPTEFDAIVAAEPTLLALRETSHTLIAALARGETIHATSSSSSRNYADPAPTTEDDPTDSGGNSTGTDSPRTIPSRYHFIWLDYCGTLASRAGRQRQTDIRQLIEGALIYPHSVLAVTLTARGSQPWYKDELVDTLVHLIRGAVARAEGMNVVAIDCCSYRIEGPHPPMYTVVARIQPAGSSLLLTDPELFTSIGPLPSNVRLTSGWVCADGSVGAPRRAPCQLLLAAERIAGAFSQVVAKSFAQNEDAQRGLRVLTLESKLAPVACALLSGPNIVTVTTVVVDADEAAIATAVLDQCFTGTHSCHNKPLPAVHVTNHDRRGLRFHLQDNPELSAKGFDVVWLGYERGKPRPSRELVQCDGWADLNFLLSSGALGVTADNDGVVGVLINADRTKLCWDAAEVDWLVAGVQATMARHQLLALPEYVARCTIGSAQVSIIFRVTLNGGARTKCGRAMEILSEAEQPKVSHWEEFVRWDSMRTKIPTTAGVKHRRAAGPCVQALARGGCKSILVHEPGFFSVVPGILAHQQHGITITCCTDGDVVQFEELQTRYSELENVQAHLQPPESALDSDALVLFTDGGVASFERSWGGFIDAWRQAPGRVSDRRRMLIFLVDCPAPGQIALLAARAALVVCETHPIWCNSRHAVLAIASEE